MYRYEYERISCDFSGYGLLRGSMYDTEGYRQIIEKRAEDGWRYVGFLPALQRGSGQIEELDLVFEREIN